MSNTYQNQFLYSKHAKLAWLEAKFVVTPTDPRGITLPAGQTQLSPGISNVFMHTSTTPAAGNPNPANGEIIVQLTDSYRTLYSMTTGIVSQLVGSPSTSTTANVFNVITALGTATTAQWQVVGLPVGITPAVGVSFVATSTAVVGGSATVDLRAVAGSGIDHVEIVGINFQANLTNGVVRNPSIAASAGGYIYLAAFKNTALTAPTTGATLCLGFLLGDSSARV